MLKNILKSLTLLTLFFMLTAQQGCQTTSSLGEKKLSPKEQVKQSMILESKTEIEKLGGTPITEDEAKYKGKLGKDKYIQALEKQLAELKAKKEKLAAFIERCEPGGESDDPFAAFNATQEPRMDLVLYLGEAMKLQATKIRDCMWLGNSGRPDLVPTLIDENIFQQNPNNDSQYFLNTNDRGVTSIVRGKTFKINSKGRFVLDFEKYIRNPTTKSTEPTPYGRRQDHPLPRRRDRKAAARPALPTKRKQRSQSAYPRANRHLQSRRLYQGHPHLLRRGDRRNSRLFRSTARQGPG